jgi:hypothetical protein
MASPTPKRDGSLTSPDDSGKEFERELDALLDRLFLRALGRLCMAFAAIIGSYAFLDSLGLSEKQLAGAGVVMSAMMLTGTLVSAPSDRKRR